MKVFNIAGALSAAAILAFPAYAHAVDLSMSFTGVVSPGSVGTVFPYDPSVSAPPTSFDGQPVNISLSISGTPGDLYVSGFSASWSNQPHTLPYITSWGGPGFPNDPSNDSLQGFFSSVSLTSTGGSISLAPTSGFISFTDSNFGLSLNYTFSTPHDPFSSFTDNGLSGGGTFGGFKTFVFDAAIGPYDAGSHGDFTLGGVTQVGVPEPAAWALMLAGFGGVGAAMRARRRSLAAV